MSFRDIVRGSYLGKIIWPFLKVAKAEKISLERKREVKTLLKMAQASDKHIFYCGVCESSNMGDMAQTYCTLNWLKNNYPEFQVLFCKTSVFRDTRCNLIEKMKKIIKPADLIIFQSGYNTHDLGDGREDLMHQMVIQAFPDNEIIMLPQTVYFQTEERKRQCAYIYNEHKKMLFLSRDPKSQRNAEEMFPNLTVKLYPDIVTSLIGYTKENYYRNGIYLCRRKDIEQYYQEDDYVEFAQTLSTIDKSVTVSDTIISATNNDIYNNLSKFVVDMIEYFSGFRFVVTDKFHGLIFSLAANTPVIVLKTKDHKVTSGYEWFSKTYPDRVFFAETAEEIRLASEKILRDPIYTKLDNYFDREYYQNLKNVIREWEETCSGDSNHEN